MIERATFVFAGGLVASLTVACAGASSRIDPEALVAPGRSTAPAGNGGFPAARTDGTRLLSVKPVAVPAHLAIDGDPAEWGNLVPTARTPSEIERRRPPPPRGPTSVDPTPEELAERGPRRQNPIDARSRMGIAIGADGAAIAGVVVPDDALGVWLGIGFEPPGYPPLGSHGTGGVFFKLSCTVNRQDFADGARYDSGEPNPPEVLAACKAAEEKHAADEAAHARRFARIYRIDPFGARLVGDDGKLVAVEGARVVWKPAHRGATFEAILPLASLPRMPEAPLAAIELVAQPAAADPAEAAPSLPRTAWFRDWFDAPVAFAPLAGVRARMFDPGLDAPGIVYAPPKGLSYQAADPAHVESLAWTGDRKGVNARVEPLFTPRTKLGDLEIGLATASTRALAVLRGGELVDLVRIGGEPRGEVVREGDAISIFHVPASFDMAQGQESPPTFAALAVGADGKIRDVIAPFPEDDVVGCYRYESVVDTVAPDLARLAWKGRCFVFDGSVDAVEAVWTWKPATRRYQPTVTRKPVKRAPR